MAFDLKRHVIKVQGREYLPVAARVVQFREEHPLWSIVTEPIQINMTPEGNRPPYAICRCIISDETGRVIATALKMEDAKGFPDFLEKAATGSVGRALLLAGYGTLYADKELDEGDRVVDAPRQQHANQAASLPRTEARPLRPAQEPEAVELTPQQAKQELINRLVLTAKERGYNVGVPAERDELLARLYPEGGAPSNKTATLEDYAEAVRRLEASDIRKVKEVCQWCGGDGPFPCACTPPAQGESTHPDFTDPDMGEG